MHTPSLGTLRRRYRPSEHPGEVTPDEHERLDALALVVGQHYGQAALARERTMIVIRMRTNQDSSSSKHSGTADSLRVVSLEFFEVELRPDGIVWLKRNQVSYEMISDVHRAYDQFLPVVKAWHLDRRIASGDLGTRVATPMGWLYDLRLAPTQRNDQAFESAILERSPDLLELSPFVAVLVKTAAGRLQNNRLARADALQVRVSDDLDDSIAWLQERLWQKAE
jgi:hypothetical protein